MQLWNVGPLLFGTTGTLFDSSLLSCSDCLLLIFRFLPLLSFKLYLFFKLSLSRRWRYYIKKLVSGFLVFFVFNPFTAEVAIMRLLGSAPKSHLCDLTG
jgi:hypothetical protein